MIKVLSSYESRLSDENTVKGGNVTVSDLVSRAGKAVTEEILKRFSGGKVLVVIGKGNNGEDGKVIADLLSQNKNFSVNKAENLSLPQGEFDIIVDCLFGTGLNRAVTGEYENIIHYINRSKAFIISVDIPSGLSADSGKVLGIAVKADLTVVIQNYKLGHFLNEGIDFCGETVVKEIGIKKPETYANILERHDLTQLFIKPKRNVNKGSFKKAAIIGGSKTYSGSAVLAISALAAFKTGLGYANIAVPDCVFPAIAGKAPECTVTLLKDDGNGIKFYEEDIIPLFKYDSLAVGLGMGATEETYKLIKFILKNYSGKVLIDADGLNSLAFFGKEILKEKRNCQVVLTPHIAEFARLNNTDKKEVVSGGVNLAKTFAKEYGVVLVLKSAVSVITDGNTTFLNVTGTPAMAKAGSGDVLSGFAAGMLAREENPVLAAAYGCYLFGRAGEIAEETHGNTFTVTATDLITALPKAVAEIIG